ncbi:MAG: PilN domain-containing protein [Candidatus Eremiobacteraeota bacterium]|nr:PilN domain-containing protein [Candidatus Eremiobacteraeota bacterium]MBV8284036.1 PilN domain-containing protein [Candidatus Eremiobacteraeota bacterium]MBV8435608.1 PilN domain-containing protein [Candidatus Eremiobacteraeota bacterium]MBV8655118.1 PilN domain-containing protein [Candidatus Eremiobacteraeota bacterium]
MMRFDFLHDAPPGAIDAVRSMRLPRRFHDVAAALVAMVVLCVVAAGIERTRIAGAQGALSAAHDRFERSREALQRLQVQSRDLETLLAEDRALRDVRLSGPKTAERLAEIGNLFPADVTLDAMEANANDYDLKGSAQTLARFGTLLSRLDGSPAMPRPASVRISKDAGVLGALSFEVATERQP